MSGFRRVPLSLSCIQFLNYFTHFIFSVSFLTKSKDILHAYLMCIYYKYQQHLKIKCTSYLHLCNWVNKKLLWTNIIRQWMEIMHIISYYYSWYQADRNEREFIWSKYKGCLTFFWLIRPFLVGSVAPYRLRPSSIKH